MDRQLNVRFAEQELEELKAAAAREHRSVSDFVRDRVRPSLGMTSLSGEDQVKVTNDLLEAVEGLDRRLARLEEMAGL